MQQFSDFCAKLTVFSILFYGHFSFIANLFMYFGAPANFQYVALALMLTALMTLWLFGRLGEAFERYYYGYGEDEGPKFK